MAEQPDVRPTLFGWEGAVKGQPAPKEQHELLFQQYKLYLELADQISHRRQTANSFFVAVNTALVALIGYVNSKEPMRAQGFYLLICVTGAVLSHLWFRIIKSYRDLNTAKFAVIHEIERFLPLRPYKAEWDYVGHGKKPRLYKPFTHIEILVPWLFMAVYLVIIVALVLS